VENFNIGHETVKKVSVQVVNKHTAKKMQEWNTHLQHVIVIAFWWQQWLHERTSMLWYMYIACLVLSHDGYWTGQNCIFTHTICMPIIWNNVHFYRQITWD
jgi:hypothetical protein